MHEGLPLGLLVDLVLCTAVVMLWCRIPGKAGARKLLPNQITDRHSLKMSPPKTPDYSIFPQLFFNKVIKVKLKMP